MRQFDVYPNPSTRSVTYAPYVVVLQSHLLSALPTVLVAPLLMDDGRSAYTLLSVKVEIEGLSYILQITEPAALDPALLRKPLTNLVSHEDDIRRALDRLFTGF